MAGLVLRLLLLAAWIGLTGTHVLRHLLPGLGMVREADAAATISGRLDRTYRYDMRWRSSPAGKWESVGTCEVGAGSDDIGARTWTELALHDTRAIPAMQLIRKALRGFASDDPKKGVKLRIEQLLDARLRLRGVAASGQVFGAVFAAEGPVDHRGLDLAWSFAGIKGRKLIPEVRPDAVAGDEFGISLPAGLKTGASFSQRFSSLDMMKMGMQTRMAVFKVGAESDENTPAGPVRVVEVEMRVEDRRTATLWCDSAGVVFRQELADQGFQIILVGIDTGLGRHLWPVLEPEPEESATAPATAAAPAQP